jgi:hypothetical protein
VDVQVTLYIFINEYSRKDGKQVKRKSFPIDSKLFQAFPHTFKMLIRYLKYKVMRMNMPAGVFTSFDQRTVEIKFGLVFSKLSQSKKEKNLALDKIIKQKYFGSKVDELDQKTLLGEVEQAELTYNKLDCRNNFSI